MTSETDKNDYIDDDPDSSSGQGCRGGQGSSGCPEGCEGRAVRGGREERDSDDVPGKVGARYALAGAVAALVMVALSELEGSAVPVAALLTLLIVRSLIG
jgi:hypothetical protein